MTPPRAGGWARPTEATLTAPRLLSPQVLVLLFTHHLRPGGDGPPRQIETPADQRAAGQAVGAQQHGQQLQPEGQSHMRRLRGGAPPRQRKHLGRTNLRAGVWTKQMKSVYLTKNQKKKQLDALKIPTGRKVDDLSTLSVARMTANTTSNKGIRPGRNNGHGVYE